MRWSVLIPGGVVLALIVVLGYGLTRDPSALPSALDGKPAPAFDLPSLEQPTQRIDLSQLNGQVALINVWASWCVACRSETDVLGELSRRTGVPVLGLNYKDTPDNARSWLKQFGNPYTLIAVDQSGATAIDYGVSGVPETFVIDQHGVIRDKVVGPISDSIMRERLIPELRHLKSSP